MTILNIITAYNQSHFEVKDNIVVKFEKDIDTFTKEYLTGLVAFGQKPHVCHVGVWTSFDTEGEEFFGKPQNFGCWKVITDLTEQYKEFSNYKN